MSGFSSNFRNSNPEPIQTYIILRHHSELIEQVFSIGDHPAANRDTIITLINSLYECIKVSYNHYIHQMINAADELLLEAMHDEDRIHESAIRKLIFEAIAENNPGTAEGRYRIGQEVRESYNYHKQSIESVV